MASTRKPSPLTTGNPALVPIPPSTSGSTDTKRPSKQTRGSQQAKVVDILEELKKSLALARPLAATSGADSIVTVEELFPVAAHAVAVFGDEHKATHWFSMTPLRELNGRTPAQAVHEKGGIAQVEKILTRIEHNIPS